MDATATSGQDVKMCSNGRRLPTEEEVLDTAGCYVSISVGNATTKSELGTAKQKYVLGRLSNILSCLPMQRTEESPPDMSSRCCRVYN